MTAFGEWLARWKVIYLYRMKGGQKNAHDFVWNWLNPLAWFFAVVGFIGTCLLEGVPDTWNGRHQLGFRMNPWFAANGYEIEWVKSYGG